MLRIGETKVAKKEFYDAKKSIKIWDVDVSNIVSIKTKNISKYVNVYLNNVIRPLVLILPKMSEYVKTFKEKNNK